MTEKSPLDKNERGFLFFPYAIRYFLALVFMLEGYTTKKAQYEDAHKKCQAYLDQSASGGSFWRILFSTFADGPARIDGLHVNMDKYFHARHHAGKIAIRKFVIARLAIFIFFLYGRGVIL
jgi:hypothetical protein